VLREKHSMIKIIQNLRIKQDDLESMLLLEPLPEAELLCVSLSRCLMKEHTFNLVVAHLCEKNNQQSV